MICEKQKLLDFESGISDQSRTTREVVKAMSSLVKYLVFEGEDHEMFVDARLPTLDTSLWWNGEQVMYSFFEKKTCPNREETPQLFFMFECF